jgi:hypothetical protein
LTTKMKMLASTVQFSRYGRDCSALLRRRRRLLAPVSERSRPLRRGRAPRLSHRPAADPSGPNSVRPPHKEAEP